VYIIRTKKIPFLQSRPSRALVFNTLLMVAIAWLAPFIFLSRWFGFVPLQLPVLLSILIIVFIYLVLAQLVKVAFYRRLVGKI